MRRVNTVKVKVKGRQEGSTIQDMKNGIRLIIIVDGAKTLNIPCHKNCEHDTGENRRFENLRTSRGTGKSMICSQNSQKSALGGRFGCLDTLMEQPL